MNAFMNIMQQMGINFGSGGGSINTSQSGPLTVADIGGITFKKESALMSTNAKKLEKILQESSEVVDNPIVICFKIGEEEPIYTDFSQGKGKFYRQ